MEEIGFLATRLSAGDSAWQWKLETLSTILPTIYAIYIKQNLFYILNNLTGLLLKSFMLPVLKVTFRNVMLGMS